MRLLSFIVMLFIAFLSVVSTGSAADPVRIAIGTGDTTTQPVYQDIFRELYKRVGLEMEFVPALGNRSFDMVARGSADAAALVIERSKEYDGPYFMVPAVMGTITIAAIKRADNTLALTDSSLRKARGATTRHLYVFQELFPDYNLVLMDDLKSLTLKLLSGQVDYILYITQIHQQFTQAHFPDAKLEYKIIKLRNLFHYVSNRYLDKKDDLTRAIQSMQEDGYILQKVRDAGFNVDERFLKRVQ